MLSNEPFSLLSQTYLNPNLIRPSSAITDPILSFPSSTHQSCHAKFCFSCVREDSLTESVLATHAQLRHTPLRHTQAELAVRPVPSWISSRRSNDSHSSPRHGCYASRGNLDCIRSSIVPDCSFFSYSSAQRGSVNPHVLLRLSKVQHRPHPTPVSA